MKAPPMFIFAIQRESNRMRGVNKTGTENQRHQEKIPTNKIETKAIETRKVQTMDRVEHAL